MTQNNTPSNTPAVALTVDARQLKCPMPLLRAKQALAKVAQSELICVQATDIGSVRDFHSFVELTCHELVDFNDDKGTYTYIIRKGRTP